MILVKTLPPIVFCLSLQTGINLSRYVTVCLSYVDVHQLSRKALFYSFNCHLMDVLTSLHYTPESNPVSILSFTDTE